MSLVLKTNIDFDEQIMFKLALLIGCLVAEKGGLCDVERVGCNKVARIPCEIALPSYSPRYPPHLGNASRQLPNKSEEPSSAQCLRIKIDISSQNQSHPITMQQPHITPPTNHHSTNHITRKTSSSNTNTNIVIE